MSADPRGAVIVFGSINVDVSVAVSRLPRPGETLIGSDVVVSPGGKGANQAHAARLFGVPTRLLGAVGDDAFATIALATLQAARVETGGVAVLDGVATGTACITVAADGENVIVVAPGANARLSAASYPHGLFDGGGFLLLQLEVPFVESIEIARRARAAGCRAVLNAAPMVDASWPEGTFDWLIVNRIELEQVAAAWSIGDDEIVSLASRVAARSGTDVALTLGAAGAVIAGADGRLLRCPAIAAAVVDTTGAGDTFAGVLAAAFLSGFSEEQSLRYAITASGLCCEGRGAQVSQPRREAIEARLPTHRPTL